MNLLDVNRPDESADTHLIDRMVYHEMPFHQITECRHDVVFGSDGFYWVF